MKLEREPVFSHLTLTHKQDSKSFDYDELSLDSNGLKSGKVVKETLNGHLDDFKDGKKDGDQLLYLMNADDGVAASKLDCLKKTENLNSYREYQSEDFVAPFTKSSSAIELMEKEMGFYADKSAVECEMPELQVCYRESSYSSVKDICVDEGVRSHDKILFESSTDEKSLCTFVFSEQDMDTEHGQQDIGISVFNANGLKSSAENELSNDPVCKSKELTPKGQVHCDTKDNSGSDISQDKIFPENVNLMKEMEADNPQFRSSICEENALPQVQKSLDKARETTGTVSTGYDSSAEKLNNNSEEALIVAPDSIPDELRNISSTNELCYSSKVEKRRITFNFKSSTPVATTKGIPENGISECPSTQNAFHRDPQNSISECRETKNDSCGDPQNNMSECPGTENASHVNGRPTYTNGCEETQKTVEDMTDETDIASEEIQDESEKECCSKTGVSESVESRNNSSVDEEVPKEQNGLSKLQHVMAAEDCPQSSDSRQHKFPDTSIAEEGLPGSQFVSGHFQFGESSFSAAGPMSGRINYSGPVPYSGSISLRSDSSTTSTRSFAFPVLPNEWNSSPVRMAKADRRHFRKHKGWRQGILCCRF